MHTQQNHPSLRIRRKHAVQVVCQCSLLLRACRLLRAECCEGAPQRRQALRQRRVPQVVQRSRKRLKVNAARDGEDQGERGLAQGAVGGEEGRRGGADEPQLHHCAKEKQKEQKR
jgi:hypothetical protein